MRKDCLESRELTIQKSMEARSDEALIIPETTWDISDGSLHAIINFNSSSDSRNSTLILKKPISSRNIPCEINLKFSQQYEIKQVYIRSSARAFRIDCKPTLESASKCLSTICCEPAYNDEDDWEIVNLPVSPSLDKGNSSRIQDFYEFREEIDCKEPCMFLTLGFILFRSEELCYIDEVYVSAIPTEPEFSSEQSIFTVVNSDANSPMLVGSETINEWSDSSSEMESDSESDDEASNSRIKSLLMEMLVKVRDTKDLLVRFEENIVDPINKLQARVSSVEQQVKEMSLNWENSKQKAAALMKDETKKDDCFDRETLTTLIRFHFLTKSARCDGLQKSAVCLG